MSEPTTDQDIVCGLIRGERVAWDALCQKYSTRLWRYVARLMGSDNQSVADVFQETLMAVARAGRNLDPDKSTLWAWLATIGHNQVALHWRVVKQRGEQPVGNMSEPRDTREPADVLQSRELILGLRMLLAEMPGDYVGLLLAKYVDQMSIREIVEMLGGTEESTRSKLARARREFRRRYQLLVGTKQAV